LPVETGLPGFVADQPDVEHLVLICTAVNAVDASALEMLEQLIVRLRDSRVTLHFAEVKGPVMEDLRQISFIDDLLPGKVFLSTHEAVCILQRCSTT